MSFSLGPLFAGFIILEWAIRLIMLFIVPRKLRPASANAWLLLIMIVPIVGTVLFFMFGNPQLTKIRKEKLKFVNNLTQKTLAKVNQNVIAEINDDSYVQVARLAKTLGGLPPMQNNKIDFLSNYDDILDNMIEEIDSAKLYINVEYFLAVLDDSTKPFFEALEKAINRGVVVRFMYDRVLSYVHFRNSDLQKFLDKIGAQTKETLPLSLIPGDNFTRPDLRNHRKIVVIDGKVAFSGSQNMIDKFYHRKDGIYYEELVLKMRGPVVWQCDSVFRSDWYAESGEKLEKEINNFDFSCKEGNVDAQVLPSGPSHDHDNNLKFYTSLIHTAKKKVGIVVPYFIPTEPILEALTAVAQRGVKVTIVNSEAIDKVLAGHAQRSYYEELLEAGIDIFLYKTPVFLHTKQLIIDNNVAVVGSSNLDNRSFELDLELDVIIYDKKTVSKLEKIEKNYILKSNKLNLEDWQKRPIRKKMLDNIARLTAGLQ